MTAFIENKLIEKFKDKKVFSRNELYDFYTQFEPNLNKNTFAWRIFNLKQKNIIKPVKRGYYTLSNKPVFQPEISKRLYNLAKFFSNELAQINFCIWESKWLNEFSRHQSNKNLIIIEMEAENSWLEMFYFKVKEKEKKYGINTFLNPDQKTFDYYISQTHNPVVIKKLISRSPCTKTSVKKTKVTTPKLEKILVDIYADKELFYLYQGSELVHIYQNALENYTINFTTLFNYAKRRGKHQEIKDFIKNNLPFLATEMFIE